MDSLNLLSFHFILQRDASRRILRLGFSIAQPTSSSCQAVLHQANCIHFSIGLHDEHSMADMYNEFKGFVLVRCAVTYMYTGILEFALSTMQHLCIGVKFDCSVFRVSDTLPAQLLGKICLFETASWRTLSSRMCL